MTIVDISSISPSLFITIAVFLLIICPLLSLGVLRLFQERKKAGLTYIVTSIVGYILFTIVINVFF
ncbi:hypothetical protein BVG16_25885 [Paenibacillus selenitireducens]|uniref:Uncharacterized protein n=1 Tax=Paenibacillus selenitireducens TaxID=1324314 RepID=A0A1T2X232_9BACL|nr:hypothetical protein [Paenibacillus selenitireducens]OPA73875.1 hypothetical protein BVG16_25885 [Paenibacillus selenitireducens]